MLSRWVELGAPLMPILGYSHAYVGSKQIEPGEYRRLFHGSSLHEPGDVKRSLGLPPKGNDLDLLNHVRQVGGGSTSAFRGSTQLFCSPDGEAGAALWGDWVYEVVNYRGYELNTVLDGRFPLPSGIFGGNPMYGEQEVAIPAEVPMSNIDAVARVDSGPRGKRPSYLADWRP